jgi:hypothetical protein
MRLLGQVLKHFKPAEARTMPSLGVHAAVLGPPENRSTCTSSRPEMLGAAARSVSVDESC